MSNIPETILQQTIINGIRHIRQHPDLLESIFFGQTQEDLARIKDFVLHKNLGFFINYPRNEELSVPCIVMTMQSDNEANGFLGDIASVGAPAFMVSDTLNSGHGASISDVGGLEPIIIQNIRVDRIDMNCDNNRHIIYWKDDEVPRITAAFANADNGCYTVFVTRGAGAGQVRDISKISNNSLDIKGTFDQQLDSSSYIDIRRTDEAAVRQGGEPSRSYKVDDDLLGKGALYDARYKLNVVGGSQYEVIYLYAILKAILLSQRVYLEGNGIHALGVQGSEFAPAGEYLPTPCYGRAMTITFTYLFCYSEPVQTFDLIKVNLTQNCGCSALEFSIEI